MNTASANNNNQKDEEHLINNNQTLQSYENSAFQYAASVSKDPSQHIKEAILQMVEIAGKGGTILEVGSGPGWDADFVESLGVTVRRTDATAAFRDFQLKRGKKIDPLNILTDEFGGPYNGIMALYVLQHIDRNQVAQVLNKVAEALQPNGTFLVCILEGENEFWQQGDVSGNYHVVFWNEADFINALKTAGLEVIWETRHVDSEGPWMNFLAQKKS
ncbi:class I SAM-dependent methyltransferase [Ferruginibacter sp.]|nr:methyltransferase domain-containing protein [Ferruginibacter sp.]